MSNLIVFWTLCLFAGIAVGFGISYLIGDKIYDKAKNTAKYYIDDEKHKRKGE